eukprot:g447.t1
MRATILFGVVATASAICPNSCSGHGRCGSNDKCSCYQNWQSADCSFRTCPFSLAWADTADGTNQAHYYAECGNKGLCDRKTGDCNCYDGFEGKGCRRLACPAEGCNGKGICEYIGELAQDYKNRRYGPGYKFKDLSCTSPGNNMPGTGGHSSCWEKGQPLGTAQPFLLNISEAKHYDQCGATGDEFCDFTEFTILDGGKNCDLTFPSLTFAFDGSDNTVVDISQFTIDVGLDFYTALQSGMKLTYSANGGEPIGGLTEGTVYYAFKREETTQILLMTTASAAKQTYANQNSEKSAAIGFSVPQYSLDGSGNPGTQNDFGLSMSLTLQRQITYETKTLALTLSNAPVASGGPVDVDNFLITVGQEMYYMLVDVSPLVVRKVSGTSIATDNTYYVVKGTETPGVSGEIMLFSTIAHALAASASMPTSRRWSEDIPTGNAVTLAAAGDGTTTFTLNQVVPAAIVMAGGTGCRSTPTIRFTIDEGDAEASPVDLYSEGFFVLLPRLELFRGATTHNIVSRHANTDVTHGHHYNLWDARKIQACKCDLGWYGPGCETRLAPRGDDPLTAVKSNPMQQAVQIGSISAFSTDPNLPEQFTMTYHDPYGGVWKTDGIDATTDDQLAATRVQNALRALPNKVLEGVTVHARTSDTVKMCTRFYDGVQHLAAYPESQRRPGSFKSGASTTNFCEMMYTFPTDANKMDLTVHFADMPGQTGVQYLLEVDVQRRGPGHYPISRGITGHGAMYSVAEINYNENLGNLSELSECSDRMGQAMPHQLAATPQCAVLCAYAGPWM